MLDLLVFTSFDVEVFHFRGGDLELFGENYMIGDSSLVMHV